MDVTADRPEVIRASVPERTAQVLKRSRATGSRPHIYELDLLRTVTALCVIGVHVVSFTIFLDHTTVTAELQNAVVGALHFTRELFMFVTGLALTYVYFGKPFSWRRFWSKRSIGVLFPYVLWSLIYVLVNDTLVNHHVHSVGQFLSLSLYDVVTGNASYQLYYILLTLQFYLILPLFLWFIGRVRHHPWTALAISFGVQVALLALDYYYLETQRSITSPVLRFFSDYQNRIVFMYEFYFILGGLVAIYLDQVRAWLARRGWLCLVALAAGLAALWGNYLYAVQVQHASIGYGIEVLQPIMAIYAPAVIAFLAWIAYRWARKGGEAGKPRGARWWGLLSDASFGLYLVHPLFLTFVGTRIVPLVAGVLPGALVTGLTWFLTASLAILLTVLLMKTPVLSRTVGRKQELPRAWRLPTRTGKVAAEFVAEGTKD